MVLKIIEKMCDKQINKNNNLKQLQENIEDKVWGNGGPHIQPIWS